MLIYDGLISFCCTFEKIGIVPFPSQAVTDSFRSVNNDGPQRATFVLTILRYLNAVVRLRCPSH
jgi:hypothetical protein